MHGEPKYFLFHNDLILLLKNAGLFLHFVSGMVLTDTEITLKAHNMKQLRNSWTVHPEILSLL